MERLNLNLFIQVPNLTALFGKLNLYLNVQSMYGSVHALGITHQIGRSGLIRIIRRILIIYTSDYSDNLILVFVECVFQNIL
jgi:hypothetical protein